MMASESITERSESRFVNRQSEVDNGVDVVDFGLTKSTLGLDKSEHNKHAEKLLTSTTNLWSKTIDARNPKFSLPRKKNEPNCVSKERSKLSKCSSIARLFGNTYNTQQLHATKNASVDEKSMLNANAKRITTTTSTKTERFKKCPENQIDEIIDQTNSDTKNACKNVCSEKDVSGRTLRTLSKSIGRLWRRSHSVEISTPDPEYKVLYLGNVLTGWAKGDSCVEKPLATLWRNYTQNHKPDVVMRFLVCSSGLKATTRQHGLTEYWSNRITHCCSPKNYPRIFCWIYRHEGRKLKNEMRCHAILCAKDSIAEQICKTLKENIARALQEFKRDKINRQNARLSLVNSVYENPSMPRRKILLSVGANNYRPPMERSKSAPKLMAIEEAVGEEDEDEDFDDEHGTQQNQKIENKENRMTCSKIDPLFPAMTLGRRHGRRGYPARCIKDGYSSLGAARTVTSSRSVSFDDRFIVNGSERSNDSMANTPATPTKRQSTDAEEDDDFNSLLMVNDYDSQSSLSGELLSYFDSKLSLKSAVSLTELHTKPNVDDEVSMSADLYGHRITMSLDNLDQYSDEDQANEYYVRGEPDDDDIDENDGITNTFYNQDEIIDCLVNVSMQQKEAKSIDDVGTNDEIKLNNRAPSMLRSALKAAAAGTIALDSDEGSISSGCETSSNATTSNFDDFMRTNDRTTTTTNEKPVPRPRNIIGDEIKISGCANEDDCNSEVSDESGFDELQNYSAKNKCRIAVNQRNGINGAVIGNNSYLSQSIRCDSNSNNSISKRQSSIAGVNDRNNNSIERNAFSGDGDTNNNHNKEINRLMINIPKNAKSILI